MLKARTEGQQRCQRGHIYTGAVHEADACEPRQLPYGEDKAHVSETRAPHKVQTREAGVCVCEETPAAVCDCVGALEAEGVEACSVYSIAGQGKEDKIQASLAILSVPMS